MKKFLVILCLFLIAVVAANIIMLVYDKEPFFSPKRSRSDKKALILYDSANIKNLGPLYSVMLANLLGHFDLDYEIEPVEDYQQDRLEGFDTVFYFGCSPNLGIPEEFLRDIAQTKKTVCWFQHNLDQLQEMRDFDFESKYGFLFLGVASWSDVEKEKTSNFLHTFFYNDHTLKRDAITDVEYRMGIAKLSDDSKAEVFSTVLVEDKHVEIPYIIKADNFWYIADIPFEYYNLRGRYLILCDVLHDILDSKHPIEHKALLRLEDVNPSTVPEELAAAVKFLEKEDIPFSIATIPFFEDPTGEYYGHPAKMDFSDSPRLLQVLKRAQHNGAAIIMHGVTHQMYSVQDPKLMITAVGYEFWDSEKNLPIENDSVDYVKERLRLGKKELLKNGLKPIAFEAPHYIASALDYRVIAKEFDATFQKVTYHLYDAAGIEITPEKLEELGRYHIQQIFPYIIDKDVYGQKVIPASTLSYITYDDAQDEERLSRKVELILEQAKALQVVRDGYASFYIHPFVIKAMDNNNIDGKAVLKILIDGIKELGYEFVDVKKEINN